MRAAFLAFGVMLLLLAVGCAAPISAMVSSAQILPIGEAVNGRILFVSSGNVWVWSDGRPRQLTSGGSWRQPKWSPDGGEIAYVYQSRNFSDIFVMNADGSGSRRLTKSQSASLSDNDWVLRPTWSPDGSRVAFVSDKNDYNPTAWVMNRDGTGLTKVPISGPLTEAADAMAWTPDGKRLAVTAFGATISQIVLVDLTRQTQQQQLTDNPRGAIDPAWSPDGQTLAYASRESGRMDIRLKRFDGSAETVVTSSGLARAPTWAPDGRRLAYLSSRDGDFEVYVVDVVTESNGLAVRNERQLTRDLNIDAPSGLSWGR